MPKTKPQLIAQDGARKNAFRRMAAQANEFPPSYTELENEVKRLQKELTQEKNNGHQQIAEKERYASRLSQLLFALPAGVVVLDMHGRIQDCNPAALELLGEPLVDELWRTVIDRAFEPSGYPGQEAKLRNGRMVSLSTCPLGNEPGQIILLMDVTETRFLQQSLERHQRLSAMGEMSAKLAHQVRTPLASALLYISNLLKSNLSETDRTKFVEKALSRLQHLENVVEDMLSFSRVGDQVHDLIAVSDLLDELQHAVEMQLETEGCRMYVKEHADNFLLHGNVDALLGVFQNIVNNAVQACGEGGIIWLETKPVDFHQGIPSVDITFRDNGPGISSENLEKVFDPFYTTRPHGTGLGLAVARAVVENHGGSIWIDSSSGKGTSIIIRLPLGKNSES